MGTVRVKIGEVGHAVLRVALSAKIVCKEAYLVTRLTPDTITLVNAVEPDIRGDGAALVVEIASADHLQAALALPGAPFAPGVDPDASVAAFRAWLIAGAVAVRRDVQVAHGDEHAPWHPN